MMGWMLNHSLMYFLLKDWYSCASSTTLPLRIRKLWKE